MLPFAHNFLPYRILYIEWKMTALRFVPLKDKVNLMILERCTLQSTQNFQGCFYTKSNGWDVKHMTTDRWQHEQWRRQSPWRKMGNDVAEYRPATSHVWDLSRWYYWLKNIKIHEFGIVSNVGTSLPNFMRIRSSILEIQACDWGRSGHHGDDVITHGHVISHRRKSWVMASSWRIIRPPHDFEHPSRSYHQLQEIGKYESGQASNGITCIPNFVRIRTAVLEFYVSERVVR
jgi:hypothetical protein